MKCEPNIEGKSRILAVITTFDLKKYALHLRSSCKASSSAGAQALANRNYEVFKEHILKMVKSERRTYRAHGRHPKQNYSRKTAAGRDS